nr:type IV secretory system conjugative DNA transfer family protein [uncultured Tyzzerella sp.]
MKKKQKIIFVTSLPILGFVGNVYLSEMLNTLLLGGDVHLENLNFFTNLKDIFITEQKTKLFLILECVKYLGIVYFSLYNNKPYQSELVKITDNIYTPKQVGQYQYGSSRWLTEKEKDAEFGYFILNPKDELISKLIKNGKEEIKELKNEDFEKDPQKEKAKIKTNKGDFENEKETYLQKQQDVQVDEIKINKDYLFKIKEVKNYAENMVNKFKDTKLNKSLKIEEKKGDDKTKIIEKGGIVIGMTKEGDKEKIHYIKDDVHTLVVGATRSGKSRCLVIPSICTIGLSGESMVISDPKGELFQYTNEYLKSLGYDVICLDYKNPNKSTRYNLLQPVIDAVNNGDMEKAEMYAWDITNILVGDNVSNERIWENGEKSVIAVAILSVVLNNIEDYSKSKEEYQNLTNVYWFIAEMNKKIEDKYPIDLFIENLPQNHPARALLSISEVAPSRTRGSFFTSALTTLRLFTSKSIYNITNTSDCRLEDIGRKKQAIFFILPDEKTTYYQVASLVVSQLYELLVRQADERGGRLKNRVNFILDEFGNFVKISDFTNKLTVAGGRGMRFNLFLQSFEQLDMKYGKEESHIIKSNCQNWVYLQADDEETLQSICNKLGKYTTSAYQLSSNHAKFTNPSSSHSLSLVSRELLTTDEIRRIKRPYQIVIGRSYPCMSIADDLSKWYFNTMCGLGDEEHNRKIRQKRENEREIININSEIKLWNIWNCYKSMIKNKSFENSINQKPKKDDETFIKSKKENSISTQKINLNKGN